MDENFDKIGVRFVHMTPAYPRLRLPEKEEIYCEVRLLIARDGSGAILEVCRDWRRTFDGCYWGSVDEIYLDDAEVGKAAFESCVRHYDSDRRLRRESEEERERKGA